MKKQAIITSQGQITLPREIRRVLGVREGDALLFETDGEEIRVRRIREKSAFSKYRGIGNPGIRAGKNSIGSWLRELRGHGSPKR